MLPRISWLSWLIFALSVLGSIVLAWNVDPHTRAGDARIVGSGITGIVAVLTLVSGAWTASRIAAIEAGRYPRMRPGASRRIAERIQRENPQTVTIDGEGGDDIREVAAVLNEALRSANWHVRPMRLDGTLWDAGAGIMVYRTAAAAPAAAALIEALRGETLPVTYAGDCATGMPVHVAFRRP
jgi:hypothetical protein